MPSELSVAGDSALPKGEKLGWVRTLSPSVYVSPCPQYPSLAAIFSRSFWILCNRQVFGWMRLFRLPSCI